MGFVNTKTENFIFHIRLNRPEKKNAFHPQMIEELTHAFLIASRSSSSERVVLLSAEGSSFCAGADLEWMRSMAQFTELDNLEDSQKLQDLFLAGFECNLPIIAQVQGHVYGGALGLLAIADKVIAEKSTQFCFSEVRLGLSPAVISSFVLNRSQHPQLKYAMMNARIFTAQEAQGWGLVNDICDAADLEKLTRSELEVFKTLGPQAVQETKRLIRDFSFSSWKDHLSKTPATIAKLRVGDEGQSGLKAFFEKSKAEWVL